LSMGPYVPVADKDGGAEEIGADPRHANQRSLW
jgi:hypothetical protein